MNTPKDLYQRCAALNPSFKVEILFTGLVLTPRTIGWSVSVRPPGGGPYTTQSYAIPFGEGTEFEPKLLAILQQAFAVLSAL